MADQRTSNGGRVLGTGTSCMLAHITMAACDWIKVPDPGNEQNRHPFDALDNMDDRCKRP
jgi:hypothetical protein